MKIFKKIMDIVAMIEKFILIVTGLGTTVITFLAVVGRKTALYKFTWSEEIVINVFIIISDVIKLDFIIISRTKWSLFSLETT